MSIKVISRGNTLQVVQSTDPIPDGESLQLFTLAEVERMVDARIWKSLPSKSREDLMFQAQALSYQDWMNEDEWDTKTVLENAPELPLSDFRP